MEFKTIEQMEKYYYTEPLKIIAENQGVDVDTLVAKTKDEIYEEGLLTKDAPVVGGTSGARNYIYGADLWSLICTEANVFGALPKKPYQKGGYRVITAAGSTATAGIAEGAAIPAPIKPTFVTADVGLKPFASSFALSEVMEIQAGKDDVITWGELQEYSRTEFLNRLNRGLLSTADTVTATEIQTLDRIISAKDEVDTHELDANDADIYGLDRDAGTTYDAQVFHNADTARTFEISLLDNLIDACSPYWRSKKNKVIITGYDTARRITQLERPKEVYAPDQQVEFTVNGVKTVKGKEAGIPVASFDGIPIIISNNVLKKTISHIYLVDLDTTWIGVGRPVTYTESSDPNVVGFRRRGAYSMVAETVCTNFAAQGKIIDLK